MATRRNFFKTVLGLGAGASAFGLAQQARPKLRVGVLAPAGAKGFRAALERSGGEGVEWLHRAIGATPRSAVREARELLEAGVSALVALGDGLEEALRPLAEEHAAVLILSEVGVLMPRRVAPGVFVFRNSLRQWQAEWAMGAWSAAHRGPTAVVVTGLLEAGYDLPYAFRSGFEAAGGRVLATLVSDAATGKHDFASALAQVRSLGPATVHLIGSSREGLEFAQHCPNVTVSGFSLGALPSALQGAYGATTAPGQDGLEALGQRAGAWLKAAAVRAGSRGLLAALRETARTDPIFLSRVQGGERVKLEQLAEPPAHHPALLSLAAHPRSGWTNLYPHV
ncbi:hypothetical protein [Calidithermus chliarophilus]|uniref:hypothetical protein n=1 Tax=Calidithermus chliarophilus TaxID=52023 RepID=UPI0004871382|nr:hypothetical protein [Calidithermus chliarophilus]